MTKSLTETLGAIKPLNLEAMETARRRQDTLTKPQGSLGQLEDLAILIAGITGNPRPKIRHKAIITMAADHGVAAEGISLYPQEVTGQMVLNFLGGGAGINVLARHVGARVVVVDMGVIGGCEPHSGLLCKMIDFGTKNIAREPAMSRQQALDAIEAGIEVLESEIAKGLDIVGTGDMGIGNTTASSAVCAVMTGKPVVEVTGRGTGLRDEQLTHKVAVIEKALQVNQPNPDDPLDVLARVGGFEIGGLAGVMLGAAANRIPVVIDGFISGAAALIAAGLSPTAREYFIAAHLSVEAGHRVALEHLGLTALLNLRMRLGEGTGAALAISIAEAATKVLDEMATFEEAGVSESEEVG
ncbi:MAG: nicotinate-nucleotide--dimethylbenzimidazole phosphoribosyltransferase [Dehalococcoidia bacterium]|nr:Nicotinate-nucleotide--dimethylbenzimidazole phosphoribosyltransferase [Chloroflexota bacterium]MBT9159707.1 Nicotinate-nucleotide--dimethylbenzimidazole phosphoribosyltransferase [Chloroflexota bacterium]MBT9161598.1 Nicotinate-nucleotide--dimethylbenzimidazole phosphoribosyltransferase [Chloroflexota bacterium]